MDRRSFFTQAFRKTAEKAVELVDAKVTQEAKRWFRPPYAINELDFLLACTRCQECVEACPHQVIFPLPARYGVKVVNTPALDLLNKACHLCDDWPCVNACHEKALQIPRVETATEAMSECDEGNDKSHETMEDRSPETVIEVQPSPPLPRLAEARINQSTCFTYQGPECGACNVCPVPGALAWDHQRPHIDTEYCVGCGLCRVQCIVEPSAIDVVVSYRMRGVIE